VYSNANLNATARFPFPADQVEQTPTVSSEMRSVVSDVSVLSFVSDATVPQLTLASTAEEYESDSNDSDNVDIESEERVIGKPIMTRSGIEDKSRSGQALMFRRAQNGKTGHTDLLIKAL